MRDRALCLWKYNAHTGYWDYQRTVTPETAAPWLAQFQKTEPHATFRLSKNRPTPAVLKKPRKRLS